MPIQDHTETLDLFWQLQQEARRAANHAQACALHVELDRLIDTWEEGLDPLPQIIDVTNMAPSEIAIALFRACRAVFRQGGYGESPSWEIDIQTPGACMENDSQIGEHWRVCFESYDHNWGVAFTNRNEYRMGDHTFVGMLDNEDVIAEPYYAFDVIFSEL